MSTRTSLLTLATAAAFGAAAFAPSGASAKPILGVIIKPKPVMGVVIKPQPILGVIKPKPIVGIVLPPHPVMGVPVKQPPITGIVIHPPPDHDHDHDWDHDHDHDWDGPHFRWWRRPPVIIEGSAPVASTPVAAAPSSPGPCTCLTKSYLQDGSVLFQDACTKESALATPTDLRAQMQGK
jgi:hypothetical protein